MTWIDYGFDGFDMALKPIDLTLQGMFLALKERLDVENIVNTRYNNFANNYYKFYLDADGSRTSQYANRYHGVEDIISSLFNGFFVDSISSNTFTFYYNDINTVLDKACNYLFDNGFQTTKVPFGENWKLKPYDKHWLIQRKVLTDMMRYWLVDLPESWTSGTPKLAFTYQRSTYDYNNPIYQDTLQDVFLNLDEIKIMLAPWSSPNILPLFYVNKSYRYDVGRYGYYCQGILHDIYIEKNFADSVINTHNDSNVRVKFYNSGYDDVNIFNGRILLQDILLNDTYTFTDYGTFYKMNFPYSFNDLVDIVLDNAAYFEEHGYMFEQMAAKQYLYQVKDGADSFQFLDPIA